MTNIKTLEIYDRVKSLDGKIGTVVSMNHERTGIISFTKTKTHIMVTAPGYPGAYLPLNEETRYVDEVRDENNKVLYKNTYKRNTIIPKK